LPIPGESNGMRFVGINMKIMLMELARNVLSYFHEIFPYGRKKYLNHWKSKDHSTQCYEFLICYFPQTLDKDIPFLK
jgi:hypothetical protein